MINIENYLRINPVDMIMVLISTLLIVFIVKKYFWNILKDYLDNREQFINNQIEESKTMNAESLKLNEKATEKLSQIHNEAKEIISKAHDSAKVVSNSIIDDAKKSADLIKDKAQSDIEREKIQAVNQIKDEMSSIVVEAATKIIGKEVDEKVHSKYVQDFIDEAGGL